MNNYQYEHNSFVLYKDTRIFINRLTKSQRGELLRAIFDYACDGIVFDAEDDPVLQMCFDYIKSYLDRDEKKYRERCEKNRQIALEREATRKAAIAKRYESNDTNVNDRKRPCTNDTDKDKDKDTDNDIDNDNVIDTDTDKETDSEADAVFVKREAEAEAVETAPPPADLFSLAQVKASAERNKVNITTEGIKTFYDQMHEDNWTLYNKPVKKQTMIRALREWAKKHPEYSKDLEDDENNNPEPETEPEPVIDENEEIKKWIGEYL